MTTFVSIIKCECGEESRILGSKVTSVTLHRTGECKDCGDKRREAEEAVKAARLERLFNDAE